MRSARMRASVSVGPPAVNGTTMVICFDGNVSALAAGAARQAASIIRPAMTLLRNDLSPNSLLRAILAEAAGIARGECGGQFLAFHLAGDQPAGRGGERQADMLMAVAAIDVGQPRRAADRRPEVGQARPLADPAAALGAADAGEDRP